MSRNYLQLTVLKVKPCKNVDISNYKLNFEFQGKTHTTDNLPGKEVELGKV